MSNIFPPPLVRRLKEEYDFEESLYFDTDSTNDQAKKALIIVDMQNDFLPRGSLAVAGGDEVLPVVNKIQSEFNLIVATQDWHPVDHASFASNHAGKNAMDIIDLDGLQQILWPDHCVQGSKGAEFSVDLETHRIELIVRKGTNKRIDSYSAFFDNGHKKSTGLAGYLIERGVQQVTVCGLAADFCVYYTAMDALELGFQAEILLDGTRAIDPDGFEKKIQLFKKKGGKLISKKERSPNGENGDLY
ncbi:bifunctional nicotinamidase/pyrazinamidase [Albibacterium profundi]|uniref:nicotinamidase n=1 Tax=Albibacterium profundi TaxID=3134906 RepID=A0ABV5CCH1_9SPHI